MIFLVNGLFKSGSSWVFTLLRNEFTSEFAKHHVDLNSPNNFNLKYIDDYICRASSNSEHLVVKSHIYNLKFLNKMLDSGVFVIFTHRPVIEILQSHYWHFKKENSIEISFFAYVWTVGVIKAAEVQLFDSLIKKNRLYSMEISYDSLHQDRGLTFIRNLYRQSKIESDSKDLQTLILKSDGRLNKTLHVENGDSRAWFFSRPTSDLRDIDRLSLMLVEFVTRVVRLRGFSELASLLFHVLPNRRHF